MSGGENHERHKAKLTKGGRKDEPQTIRVAQILHLAATNQNTWRLGKVESTTQRTHQRRNAGSNGKSIQRQRIQELKTDGGTTRHPFWGKSKNQKQKNKNKRILINE